MKSIKYTLIFIPYLLIWIYDYFLDENDGILGGWYFHRVFLRVLPFIIIGLICIYWIRKKKNILQVIGYNGFIFLTFLFLLEIFSFTYIKFFSKTPITPSYILYYDNPKYSAYEDDGKIMMGDFIDSVGRWRAPDRSNLQQNCLGKEFETRSNSLGMRSKEYDIIKQNGIVFLGDSFIEGYMISESDRLSNLLEEETGTNHYNFGIAGANPTDYYLIYKNIANKKIIHEKVMVGIYPPNDFDTYNNPVNTEFINMPLYRPYWKEDKINFTLSDRSQSFMAIYSNSNVKLREARDSLYKNQNLLRKLNIELISGTYFGNLIYIINTDRVARKYTNEYWGFYETIDWTNPMTNEFIKSFKELEKITLNKPILFLLIPDLKDVENYKENPVNKLTPGLVERFPNIKIIDLLPVFAEKENPENYYIPCDGHWNEKGDQMVADFLMQDSVYLNFLNL